MRKALGDKALFTMSAVSERVAISGHDHYLFREGTHTRLYEKLGAHLVAGGGTRFAVWAPNARSVAVVGDFNGWDPRAHPMQGSDAGIWETTVPKAAAGSLYKYHVVARDGGKRTDKADPFAFRCETPPKTGSVVSDLDYKWSDSAWMRGRDRVNALDAPWSVYEVHLGSWRRDPNNPQRILSYGEIAPQLADYAKKMGFTHVELLPVMEHPFYGSWGYQTTGYFAPTSRYGSPRDLMRMVDHLHQRGIGVILDWVPSHFPTDAFGLARFDGTPLYESEHQGLHPDWNTLQFDYARPEVRSFLVSSARHWLDRYHVDGIRVDAVASMLYLDYSRGPGQWTPNVNGGREDLDAIEFLRALNTEIYRAHPDVQTFAEESTAFPGVSRPVHAGGLGFGAKWDMGWMHDTLQYLERDPIHRVHHHGEITFRSVYAWSEHFVLPLSHDEVVHGKGSLLTKMPGDRWQQLANLRMLLGMQYAQPGRKLLFMGTELAPDREWNHESTLDWSLLGRPEHAGVTAWLRDLNRLHRETPAL